MIDYSHAKIYSDLGATVKVSGTRNGTALNGNDRVNNTFDILEFTGAGPIVGSISALPHDEERAPTDQTGAGLRPTCEVNNTRRRHRTR